MALPLIEQGIYIAASQEHISNIINKTVIISATTKIHLTDLYTLSSKCLKLNYVLFLHETYLDFPKKDFEVFLNKIWWRFGTKITAVYLLNEKDGLNFMLRIFNISEIAVYKHRMGGNTTRRLPVLIVCRAVFSIIFYSNRNLRFEFCNIKK